VVLARAGGPIADRARQVLDQRHIVVLDKENVPRQRAKCDTADESAVTVLIDPPTSEWRAQPGRGVVVVTSQEPKHHLVAQAVAGGATVLPASGVDDLLAPAVEAANAGYVLLSVAHSRAVLGPRDGGWLALTPRERQILAAIAQGHTTKQTARLLGISVRTVENLQGNLFRKLRVHRKAAALVVAHELGLLEQ